MSTSLFRHVTRVDEYVALGQLGRLVVSVGDADYARLARLPGGVFRSHGVSRSIVNEYSFNRAVTGYPVVDDYLQACSSHFVHIV